MSYRKTSIKTKIHRIKPKKSIFRCLWFWVALLVAVILAFSVYFLLFYGGIQVENIIISGNQKTSTQEIESSANEDVKTIILKIKSWEVSSKSIFLIDKNKINSDILVKFPGIENVVIKRKLPRTLLINVKERKPLGLFCSNGKCFSIDINGIIFELTITPSADGVIVRQKAESEGAQAGQKVLAQSVIDAIYDIQQNMEDGFKISLKEVMVANSERLNVTTGEGWKIYFDLSDDYDVNVQLKKLNLLLGGEISTEKRANLKYIDLRPHDRAIVCDNTTCGG